MSHRLAGTEIASVARALSEPARAAMCTALMDGRFRTAGELAVAAGVTAPTASEHLAKLVGAGILDGARQGRHRYFRIADPHVAAVIEAMGSIASPAPPRNLRESRASQALRDGRTCYDHLAGRLGVAVTDALIGIGVLTPELSVLTVDPLTAAGLELPQPVRRRPITRACVDWTERRHHVAGPFAAALLTVMLERGWVERFGSSRAVRATATGARQLASLGHAGVPRARRGPPAPSGSSGTCLST